MVIDDEGNSLGRITPAEALAMAEEKGLDLVEVSPKATPPVCKILDYSKFKYLEAKKARKAKIKGKSKEMKEMRFPIHIDSGDILHKTKRVREFLEKGHRVKLTIKSAGRPSPDQDTELLKSILTEIEKDCKIFEPPKREGKKLSVIVVPIDDK
jgi:translation initiation factor IF-3